MRSRLIVFVILAVSLVFGLLFLRQRMASRDLPRDQFVERKVRVLTYASFMSASGPGTQILRAFEKARDIKFDVITVPDAGLLLERLKLAQAGVPVDVVIGLDQLLMEEASNGYQWRPLPMDKSKWAKAAADMATDTFVPFDWSPLTFIYRKSAAPVPAKFDDLLKPEYAKAFALQDPHNSTPGLQFFHWVKAMKAGETSAWLQKFKPNVNSISPNWAFAYGLFKKEQTRFVFSYLTSLAFHWGDQKDRGFEALSVAEGHPVQVEFAAIPSDCHECELAEDLVKDLLAENSQRLIMTKNYMFPVLQGLEAGTIFSELPKLKTIPTETGKDLSEWEKVFPR